MSTATLSTRPDTVAPRGPGSLPAARRGVGAMLPLTVGYAPFARAVGSAAAGSGEPLAGWAGSWLIFGGSNTRLAVYGASLGSRWADQPRWFRWGAAAVGAGCLAGLERGGSSR